MVVHVQTVEGFGLDVDGVTERAVEVEDDQVPGPAPGGRRHDSSR